MNSTNVTSSLANDLIDLWNYEDVLYQSDVIQMTSFAGVFGDYVIYGVIFPILSAVGILANLTTFFILHHSNFRSLRSLLIDAMLLSDTLFLVTFILKATPSAIIRFYYPSGSPIDPFNPWTFLDVAQVLFVACSPLCELGFTLDLCYLVAIMGEHLAADHRATWLKKIDSLEFGIKAVVLMLNVGLLSEMIQFFKYNRRDLLYGYTTEQKKVCLTVVFRNNSYQLYDRYFFFVFFIVIPFIVGNYFLFCIVCTSIRKSLRRQTTHWEMEEEEMGRIFKGIRSTKLVIVLGVSGLITHAAAIYLYALMVKKETMEEKLISDECHVLPLEVKFDYSTYSNAVLVYHCLQVALASVKILLIYVGFDEFRRGVKEQSAIVKKFCIGFLPWKFKNTHFGCITQSY